MRSIILATGFVLATSLAAIAAAPIQTAGTGIGQVLVDEDGMTLYTFKNDTGGVSNCYGDCAAKWPPLYANEGDAGEAPYSVLTRTDGTLQWAKDGMPLYFWFQDKNPGDTSGDGVKDVWDAARP